MKNLCCLNLEIDAKRQEVMNTLERLQEEAKPLIELFGQAELYKSLKESGNLNKIAYLTANHNVTEGTVKALYLLGKHLYECGDYTRAHEHLAHFREVSTDSELGLNALWGKLATNILMEQWDVALKDLLAVKEFVDARAFANPTLQLQQRTWLLHWALPIFFNSPEARTTLLEMFHHEKTFQAAQTSCPHLLRYIIVASIVAKRRFPKELIKIVDQEAYVYSDPVTKFIETLYGLTDFEGAEAQLALCGPILDNDPYLHHVKTEFLEASRQLIFELFCKLHSCIDTKYVSVLLYPLPLPFYHGYIALLSIDTFPTDIPTPHHPSLTPLYHIFCSPRVFCLSVVYPPSNPSFSVVIS